MAICVALINKDTLNYICKGKGVTIEFLAHKLSYSSDKIKRWLDLNDSLLPTINQAKALAKVLHVPFAALYMNSKDIPLKPIPSIKNMRTVMNMGCTDKSAINIAIIDVLNALDFLIEADNELGINKPKYTEFLTINSNNPRVWAIEIRRFLDLNINEQFRMPSSRKYYLYLRNKVEEKGIFVHCFNGVSVDEIRGFAIYDKIQPIIGLNAEDRYPAKSFSIIHELVHIIKRESAFCNDNYNTFITLAEEVFCNAVAGELLVPFEALNQFLIQKDYNNPYNLVDIQSMADAFCVSKEVIIRRLLDNGKIDRLLYDNYCELIKKEIDKQREENKINRANGEQVSFPRDMSVIAVDRTSTSVCKALYLGYTTDMYSKKDIACHLGIRPEKVDKFMKEVAAWNN